jgi:uncharacterized protein YkwD
MGVIIMKEEKSIMKTISLVLILTIIMGTVGALISDETYAAKKVPLKKITLSKKSVTLKEGKKVKLTVKYTPKTTTVKKKVKWTSSKPKVAKVKNGVVTAKKAGTTTITAKVGTKTAKCKVKVTSKKTTSTNTDKNYVDASNAYTYLNNFRTEANVWYWNKDDTTKTYFNTPSNKLKTLSRDTSLENTAKIRAKELSEEFSHTRPDGRDCFTAYPKGMSTQGENIAGGTSLTGKGATELWKETNYKYSGQGHRRNMLNSDFNVVGIAGYKKGDTIYWVQCFGKK